MVDALLGGVLSRFRNQPRWRQLAQRLPITKDYERRLVELHQQLAAEKVGSPPSGEFVPPGHFYSAIADRGDIKSRWNSIYGRDPKAIAGVDLRLDSQWALVAELSKLLESMPFGEHPHGGLRYGFENGAYSYADGTFLHLMLRSLRPRRIIEVGSGHSSACTLDTVGRFLGGETSCTFIEPYDALLRSLLRPRDEEAVEILTTTVQNVPVARFEELEANDLLFIDSTHVSKVGSDVNYLFFEVLPALKPGVYVHIHDVFPGFEYPWEWVEEGRAWTEDYLLRAFLQFNPAFEVVLWVPLLSVVDPERLYAAVPVAAKNPGGAIYLRRTEAAL